MANTPTFTPDKQKEFLDAIRKGMNKRDATEAMGVSYNTIKDRIKRHKKFAGQVRNADSTVFDTAKRKIFLDLILKGQSKPGAAQAAGTTWHKARAFIRKHPNFAKMVAVADKIAVDMVEASVYEKAIQGDIPAARLFLVNHTKNADESKGEIRWTNESHVELTGPDNGPIEIDMSPEERKEKIKAIIDEYKKATEGAEDMPKLDDLMKAKAQE